MGGATIFEVICKEAQGLIVLRVAREGGTTRGDTASSHVTTLITKLRSPRDGLNLTGDTANNGEARINWIAAAWRDLISAAKAPNPVSYPIGSPRQSDALQVLDRGELAQCVLKL